MRERKTIGYLGLGLIGGSIARALRLADPSRTQIAFHRHETPTEDLQTALEDRVIDRATNDLADFAASCDLIFLCAPVLDNQNYLRQLASLTREDCLLTDIGSVKGSITSLANELGLTSRFLGGHPMTGSEKTGYRNSSARLLENAYYLLTPGTDTPAALTEEMTALVRQMNALPVILDPREHDAAVASISHLPHLIASSLVNLVAGRDDERELLKHLAAGGFKDITRIASSSPEMWESICLSNRESITEALDEYIASLQDLRGDLSREDGSAIRDMFASSREYRDSVPSRGTGTLGRIFDLYVDIPDETGAIAILASMLAANAISIKNIGILHNREFAEGCCRVELYDEASREKAAQVLTSHRYRLFAR